MSPTLAKPADAYRAICNACTSVTLDVPGAATHHEARGVLAGLGWLECATKGVRHERWGWRCPACNPLSHLPPKSGKRATI